MVRDDITSTQAEAKSCCSSIGMSFHTRFRCLRLPADVVIDPGQEKAKDWQTIAKGTGGG